VPLLGLVVALDLFALHAISAAFPVRKDKYAITISSRWGEYHNNSVRRLIRHAAFTIRGFFTPEKFKARMGVKFNV
jgi:hypothetical protein